MIHRESRCDRWRAHVQSVPARGDETGVSDGPGELHSSNIIYCSSSLISTLAVASVPAAHLNTHLHKACGESAHTSHVLPLHGWMSVCLCVRVLWETPNTCLSLWTKPAMLRWDCRLRRHDTAAIVHIWKHTHTINKIQASGDPLHICSMCAWQPHRVLRAARDCGCTCIVKFSNLSWSVLSVIILVL